MEEQKYLSPSINQMTVCFETSTFTFHYADINSPVTVHPFQYTSTFDSIHESPVCQYNRCLVRNGSIQCPFE